jgi:hypothetical protein
MPLFRTVRRSIVFGSILFGFIVSSFVAMLALERSPLKAGDAGEMDKLFLRLRSRSMTRVRIDGGSSRWPKFTKTANPTDVCQALLPGGKGAMGAAVLAVDRAPGIIFGFGARRDRSRTE